MDQRLCRSRPRAPGAVLAIMTLVASCGDPPGLGEPPRSTVQVTPPVAPATAPAAATAPAVPAISPPSTSRAADTPPPEERFGTGPLVGIYTYSGGQRELRFEAQGLPAVSQDGRKVALAVMAQDGARGNPNLTLAVRDPDRDRDLEKIVVLTADEYEALSEAERDTNIRARLRAANALLARSTWSPLEGVTAQRGDHDAWLPVEIGGLTVKFAEPRLTVRAGTTTLVGASHPGWSAPRTKAGDVECHNPAHLTAVHASREHRILLVDIAYSGTDTCWEPEDQLHLLRLPR